MIGFLATDEWVAAGQHYRATVNVSNRLEGSPVPRIVCDDIAAGELAAKHLLDHGFRRFAFVGSTDTVFGRERFAGFSEALAARDFSCRLCNEDDDILGGGTTSGEPIGIMAVNDHRARRLVEATLQTNLQVPIDVAVVGVDDDELESLISPVALSSVAPDYATLGFEAARLLARLLRGKPAPRKTEKIPPLYVVARRSTDRFTARHPAVAAALRIMRTQSAELQTVEDVALGSGIGRRTLERLFRDEIGLPIYGELCRAKLEAVMPEIVNGEEPMFALAERAGFSDARLFNNVCRRVTGKTPGQIRRESVGR